MFPGLRCRLINTLRRHFLTEHIVPNSPRRLPVAFRPEEAFPRINSARYFYHLTLLKTLYSTAMQRAELWCLEVTTPNAPVARSRHDLRYRVGGVSIQIAALQHWNQDWSNSVI
jgi:hypothetical protein